MSKPFILHADGVYTDGDLRLALDISGAALAQARRRGELRFARRGRTLLYCGLWVMQWLEANPSPQAGQKGAGHE